MLNASEQRTLDLLETEISSMYKEIAWIKQGVQNKEALDRIQYLLEQIQLKENKVRILKNKRLDGI